MKSVTRGAGWAVAVLPAVLLTGGSTAGCEAAGQAPDRTERSTAPVCTVRTDTAPIRKRFDAFGDLASASWCGVVLTTGNGRVPGPTDVRLVGVLHPEDRDAVSAMVSEDGGSDFRTAAPPDVPAELTRSLPAHAEWLASDALDARITGGAYEGSFYVDRGTMTVLFDAVNPPAAAEGQKGSFSIPL